MAAVQDFIIKELLDLGVEDEPISSGTRLEELDIDSLDIADLMTSIKKEYGVEIPRRDLVGISVAQLAERVTSEIAVRAS
jgi:acyl carrier protein